MVGTLPFQETLVNISTRNPSAGQFILFTFSPKMTFTDSLSLAGRRSSALLEVSGVGQPAVQLGESLQHFRQLGEGGPVGRL